MTNQINVTADFITLELLQGKAKGKVAPVLN